MVKAALPTPPAPALPARLRTPLPSSATRPLQRTWPKRSDCGPLTTTAAANCSGAPASVPLLRRRAAAGLRPQTRTATPLLLPWLLTRTRRRRQHLLCPRHHGRLAPRQRCGPKPESTLSTATLAPPPPPPPLSLWPSKGKKTLALMATIATHLITLPTAPASRPRRVAPLRRLPSHAPAAMERCGGKTTLPKPAAPCRPTLRLRCPLLLRW